MRKPRINYLQYDIKRIEPLQIARMNGHSEVIEKIRSLVGIDIIHQETSVENIGQTFFEVLNYGVCVGSLLPYAL